MLHQTVNGKPLIYLDNAASSQVPQVVIDRGSIYLEHEHSNIHRGVHYLSQKATTAYEGAREKVKRFINARESQECIFVRGATEGINLVMHGYGRKFIGAGDEIIISAMEHHANIVPWQMLCEEKGARLRVIPMNDAGELLLDEYDGAAERAHKVRGGDARLKRARHDQSDQGDDRAGAQVWRAGADRWRPERRRTCRLMCRISIAIFTCSPVTRCSRRRAAALFTAKLELLEKMNPFQGGGDMIKSVTFEKTTYADLPNKFEAGTPAIASQIGLGAAIDYLNSIGREQAAAHEARVAALRDRAVSAIEGVRIIGTAKNKASVLSFVIDDIHPHDIGTILDQEGIAVRAGHHCAQPVMQRFNVPATARASFAFYNTKEESRRAGATIESIEIFVIVNLNE